jgi:demethylmenaquinone methyltransferase/2-methoxy-6-polyprenyl-1,4-benzoquinol methylase
LSREDRGRRPLYGLFNAITPRYDLINALITWGMDRMWRKKAAEECLALRPRIVLDLCCGTGDLISALRLRSREAILFAGIDYSMPMLLAASEKAGTLSAGEKITFLRGNADRLPFAGDCLDCVGISFAFRNLTFSNPLVRSNLSEVLRILKPGGRFVIVELSQPVSRILRVFYHLYLHAIVYPLGWLLSRNRTAYYYLAYSAEHFYTAEEVEELLLHTGFSAVAIRRLFFGVACIHIATK